MQSETTTAIMTAKRDVRLRGWAAQLEAQQTSGLTVLQWCAENGIKTKSFYYRLQKVRDQYIHSAQAVIPLTVTICAEGNATKPIKNFVIFRKQKQFLPLFLQLLPNLTAIKWNRLTFSAKYATL